MKYKNYEAAVDFDDDLEMFHGTVINTRDLITFYGKSVAELKREFKRSVDDYLEFCRERNEEPDKPFSGNFVVRISPSLHQKLFAKAKRSGKSLNALIEETLAAA
ncbi:MAG: type II toxin-antitoxin system HicB family antitoxin [Acidobacteria bacterium]|nr:type II toxin-antitoxin system HicB family antitoxin [Acidobacteriota bacterium]